MTTSLGKIVVVNKKTHKATANDVYIGRPSVLGNPFTHIKDGKTLAQYIVGSRDAAVRRYGAYMTRMYATDAAYRREIDAIVARVCQGDDVNLVCWCAPLACHGDQIKRLVLELAQNTGVQLGREGRSK